MKNKEKFFSKELNLYKDNINNPAFLRDLPFDKIYDVARKESSRKKPVFFVHKYFARRITCNFRLMLLGALLPYKDDIWKKFYNCYRDDNLNNITVLDPFMGGGTTLFEAARLKMNVIGCDLQPLSKFVSTALIKEINEDKVNIAIQILKEKVYEKIAHFYKTNCTECNKEADVMYVFHVKTARTNTKCKIHKFYSNFVLALKKDLFTLFCPKCGEVYEHDFKKNGKAKCYNCFFVIENPKKGYINRGVFYCSDCGEKRLLSKYKGDDYPLASELVAIEFYCSFCKHHGYKKIDFYDKKLYRDACDRYDEIKEKLPIPNQEILEGYNTNQILNHGYKKFNEFFNKRQLLCLGMLLKEINNLDDKESQFWLQLAFSGMLEMNNMFCRYQANACKISNLFFNHAYVPITMPVENCVWGTKLGTGTFIKTIQKIYRGKRFCSKIYDIFVNGETKKTEKIYSNESVKTNPINDIKSLSVNKPYLYCGDSRKFHFLENSSIDLVVTDPPFGANVMYSELIDFFHVWNYKSSIGKSLGFDTPLSPKIEEIIVNKVQGKTQKDYKRGLQEVFTECNRVLKNNGYLIFSFHDKSIDSWKSILDSIDSSGFYLIKSYPLHSETRTGAHTSNKNSIALDIMLICKKKNSKFDVEYIEKKEEIIKESKINTLNIIKRLENVNAEITILDIENIYIANFFEVMVEKNVDYANGIQKCFGDLKQEISNLDVILDNVKVTKKRSGWWSELYKKKWNI